MNAPRWVVAILLAGFCATSLIAVLTIAKRNAAERSSPSRKQKQGDGKIAVTGLIARYTAASGISHSRRSPPPASRPTRPPIA